MGQSQPEKKSAKRIAIIGSGCSGIGALWALKHSEHEVHLYEAANRLGGHTNTVPFLHGTRSVKVDTGFIVANTATYPNFIAFLKEIGLPTAPTEMTFGVSRDRGEFEWAGTSLSAVFAQKRNIVVPSMWRMIFDIIRFNLFAPDVLSEEDDRDVQSAPPRTKGKPLFQRPEQESIGKYIEKNNYSEKFRNDYLIPMTACVWSTDPDKCSLQFPTNTLIRFLWNHHLLNTLSARPPWLTIPGGSQQYIDVVMKDFPPEQVHLSTPVESIESESGTVTLRTSAGLAEKYDHVVIATHGDQALDLIWEGASAEEKSLLSNFNTSENVAVLHSDLSLMPSNRETWSSWNYLTRTSRASSPPSTVSLTYNMNILQHIPVSEYGHVLVTLNPLHAPAPALTQGTWTYAHPLYNADAVSAQKQLGRIQNTRGISYCGAWTGYGFHEDGFTSGLRVAVEHLGAEVPFPVIDSKFSRATKPRPGLTHRIIRLVVQVIQGLIVAWLWFNTAVSRRYGKVKNF